jgi:hypothetical protein
MEETSAVEGLAALSKGLTENDLESDRIRDMKEEKSRQNYLKIPYREYGLRDREHGLRDREYGLRV